MADAVLIAKELPIADRTVEPLDILGVVRVVAFLVLNQKDLAVELDVTLVTGIAIATAMQADVGHVGVPMHGALRTVRTFVEELLIRMVLHVMGLQHLTGDEDEGTQGARIVGGIRFHFDPLPLFAASGSGAGYLSFDTVEYGMMVAAGRFPNEDPRTIGAFEAIGKG